MMRNFYKLLQHLLLCICNSLRNVILLPIVLFISLALLNSCSVFMAANKTGVSFEKINTCSRRVCILKYPVTSVEQKRGINGTLAEETFVIERPKGSITRAAMHGALDVATMGIWEVAGTPIEALSEKDLKYVVKVFYKQNGNDIKHMQLIA